MLLTEKTRIKTSAMEIAQEFADFSEQDIEKLALNSYANGLKDGKKLKQYKQYKGKIAKKK